MDFLPFGESLRSIRKRAGFTQKELAAGICTQAQISKIEKDNEIPSAIILNKISKKLGVDMNYFFEIQESHKKDYIKKIKEEVRLLKKEVKYAELLELILRTKDNEIFQEGENLKFLKWHEAICIFYLERNSEKAIELLNEIRQNHDDEKGHFPKEMDIEILNSFAILQKDLRNFGEAEICFQEALELLKQFPRLKDPTIELRILFGLAQVYTETGRYQDSLKLSQKGIKICNELEMLNLLGHFHYQVGENLARLGDKVEAKKEFDKASLIFQLQDNHTYLQAVKENEAELIGK
jgi:transcriptional regulator with XRE-family HTH domain